PNHTGFRRVLFLFAEPPRPPPPPPAGPAAAPPPPPRAPPPPPPPPPPPHPPDPRPRPPPPVAHRRSPHAPAAGVAGPAEPHASRRGMPRAAVAAAPGALLLGEHRRPGRRSVRAEVVDRVERGRELAEQPALRHAPPRGQLRGRHAVERQARHRA